MYISDAFFTSLPGGDREDKETAVYRLLDELSIPYCGLDHDRADTMEICELIEGKLGAEICKNLFLCNQQQTAFYLQTDRFRAALLRGTGAYGTAAERNARLRERVRADERQR